MFGKQNSKQIKSIIVLVTVSLILFQFTILNKNAVNTNAAPGTVVGFIETKIPMTNVNATNPCGGVAGRFDSFVEQLTNNSYVVETIDVGETLNGLTYQNYDILVILPSENNFTTEEITEIDIWVNNGGSLLLMTDWDYFGDGLRSLFRNFGYDYPIHDGLEDSDDTVNIPLQFYIDTDNMVAHDITAGVSRIEIYAGTGFNETPSGASNLIDTDNNDTTTWFNGGLANNIPVLSALTGGTAGKGKIVTITDMNIWDDYLDSDSDGDNNFFDSNNELLALNVINWLAKPTVPIPINFFSIITMLVLTSIVFIKRKRK